MVNSTLKKSSGVSLWTELETKKITTRQEIEHYLTQKLGQPNNQLSSNCLTELTKKISSYYQPDQPKNYTIYTLTGSLTSPEQMLERKFKEGKRMGQTYYILKVGQEKLQATEAELAPSKWEQIKKLAILNQELVFKYRKFYQNKQLLDFYPTENKEKKGESTIGIERK